MLCTFLHTIHGRFMDIPSSHGRVGTRIPGFGMAARTSHSESVSESASLEVLVGDGVIGDSIGITGTQCITTRDTAPEATRFTTAAPSPALAAPVPEFSTVPA